MPTPVVASFTKETPIAPIDSLNLVKPAGVLVGDLLVIKASSVGDTIFHVPSGWTNIVSSSKSNCVTCAAYRIADGTEPATVAYGNQLITKKGLIFYWKL